jgi:hypothetical protein
MFRRTHRIELEIKVGAADDLEAVVTAIGNTVTEVVSDLANTVPASVVETAVTTLQGAVTTLQGLLPAPAPALALAPSASVTGQDAVAPLPG